MGRDVVLDENAEAFVQLVVGAAQRGEVLNHTGERRLVYRGDGTYYATGFSPDPGSEMPMSASLDSPGPFTTHPITARVSVSTPS